MKNLVVTPLITKIGVLALFILLVGGVIYFDQDLSFKHAHWSQNNKTLFYLPSNTSLKRFSLGHYTFMADLIWVRTLLYAGAHFVDRGSINWIPRYINAIVTLDPKFREAYKWGSIILLYNRVGYTREILQESIELLQRARKQFPYDYYFSYSIAMMYLHELKLGKRSYHELELDHNEFCVMTEKQAEQQRKHKLFSNKLPIAQIWELRRKMRKKRAGKWLKLFKVVKSCLRKRAAKYLLDAASKENAPPRMASLAAHLLKNGGHSKLIICEHLQNLLWQADNDEMRNKLRKQTKKYCSPKIIRMLLCQEAQFTKRWKKQRPYMPRKLFTILDIPAQLKNGKPLAFPIASLHSQCSLGKR